VIYLKANFTKRFSAFILDTMILSVIFSLITVNFVSSTSNIYDELDIVLEQYENSEINSYEYLDKVIDLNYRLQKSSFMSNVLNVVLYIGYFIVFGYLNKGQTIGKMLLKIKVVNKEDENPSIGNMIVRSLFIYGIATLLYSVLFVYILSSTVFTYSYMVVTYVEVVLMILSLFMVLYKKDGRGLHDIIGRTKVIEEVK